MKRLMSYLKQHMAATICAPLFKMLEATFELIVPLIVAKMIDIGIGNHDVSYILRNGALLFLLGFIGLAASITAQYFAAKVATSTSTMMRNDLYEHIQTLSWKQIDSIGTSTLITRMTSDINTVQNGVNMFLRLFLRSPFVVLGAMILAFTVDVPTAVSFAIVIPVLLCIIFTIILITMPLNRNVQAQLDKILRKTRENLLGVRVVRAFNQQKRETDTFDHETDLLYKKQIHVGKISALLNPMTYVVINLGIVAILWIGGGRVNTGALTQGSITALVNYMTQILTELVKLANLIILLSRAIASMNRVDDVFRMQNTRVDGTDAFLEGTDGASINFDHVTFAYQEGASPALEDITFHAPAGTTLGIIGGTGSGKSTLVNLLPRFYNPDNGTVSINGKDVREIREKDLRSHIGLVPQKAVLFQGTLRDNMKWGNEEASDEQIYKALDIAQAREFVDQKSEGLDLPIEQEGRNLSGGQKQRLTIARAVVRNPQVLILDDSASALDFATDAKLRKAIHSEISRRTVILVSQRVSTIRSADQILVLDDGRLAGSGNHYELLKNCGIYRDICASQMTPEEIASDLKGGEQ
ncbi:MAG: ABC transporter ATP-binding protein/permease [Eubacterium sp.]|nr:ABC transporter ATP-binding protein/permease [Eubacterium sp.]